MASAAKPPLFFGRLFGRLSENRKDGAKKFVDEAYRKHGGPTPELKRVYGAYLEYKRKNVNKLAKD